MEKYTFVILHYNVIEETEKCIESIKKLNGYRDCYIIVVDNASSNNTGEVLKERYKEDKKIHVLLREKNDGFSRGNNEGCKYAIQKYAPDFLIVTNNDVEFRQTDFLDRISKEYIANKFSVLGPDVYNPINNNHQSPMALKPPTKHEVEKAIILNRIVLFLYPFVYPLMKKYYNKIETNYSVNGYDNYLENVCLHGACMIYSREYYEKREKIFYPETDFYYEEYIQALGCRYTGDRVIYQPAIQVFHMQGRATSTSMKNLWKRIYFRTQNILNSAQIYKDYLFRIETAEQDKRRN